MYLYPLVFMTSKHEILQQTMFVGADALNSTVIKRTTTHNVWPKWCRNRFKFWNGLVKILISTAIRTYGGN